MMNMTDNSTEMTSSLASKCPYCGGSGKMIVYKVTPESEALYGKGEGIEYAVDCKYCNGYVMSRANEYIERSNVPSIFERATIDSFDWGKYPREKIENTKNYVRSYLINFKSARKDGIGFYIYSQSKGTGKTMLASCIVNTLIKEYGIVGKYVPSYQLIDVVQGHYPDKFGDEPIKSLTTCDVLVIDDLGQKTTGMDWMNDLIYQIADERMNARKLTIYTSNYKPENLPYDDRVKDRVNSCTQMVVLPDVSVRFENAKEQKKERYSRLLGEQNENV